MLSRDRRRGLAVLALTFASAGMLVAVPSALGQAAIDEYIPSAEPAGHNGGRAGDAPGGASPAGDSGSGSDRALAPIDPGGAGITQFSGESGDDGSGSAGGADAPGTDYPLTPFVVVLVAILVVGLMAKWGASVFKRRLARDES